MAAGTQWGCGAALLNGPLTLWNMLVEALSKVADARDVHPRKVVWQGRSIDVLVREWADGVEVGAFVETMLDLLLGSPYLRAAVAAAAGGSGGGAEYSDKNAEGQEDAHVCCCGAAVTADAGNYTLYELVRGGWHRSMHAACSFVAHADAAAAAGPTRSS
jgi:hypothetical protein